MKEKQSKPISQEKGDLNQFLKNLEPENEMIDDHGPAIIGRRDRKPLSQNVEEQK